MRDQTEILAVREFFLIILGAVGCTTPIMWYNDTVSTFQVDDARVNKFVKKKTENWIEERLAEFMDARKREFTRRSILKNANSPYFGIIL